MFKEVKEAMMNVQNNGRVLLEFSIDDFKGCSKEEKIDICQDGIDEIEEVIDDLETLKDALEDYSDDLED